METKLYLIKLVLKEEHKIKNSTRNSFKQALFLNCKDKKKISSAFNNNSSIIFKKNNNSINYQSQTAKNFFQNPKLSVTITAKPEPFKQKIETIDKIRQYKIKNQPRSVSCAPGSKRKNLIFNLKYLNKQNVPSHLNVLNLILRRSASQLDVNLIENKMIRITKLSEINKLNTSTTKKLYEYNIIYGHNTNNIIKSYTPKLFQFGNSSNKKVEDNEMLQIFTEEQIRELFFQKCIDLDVPIKEELMNRFINFIREKCVNRVINLSDCSLGFNSMVVLSEILRNNFDLYSRIILTKNNFGDEGIELLLESIEGNNNIVELNLSSNSLGASGGNSIFNFLLKQNSIISLDLSSKEGLYRNRICADGVKLISKVLKNNFFLEKIDLSSNSIKNEGMKYIVNGLISNQTLHSLIIPNNEINEKGLLYLESKLKICKLKHLNISCNPISSNGLIALGNCLAGDKLGEIIYLNISECSILFDSFYQFIKRISKNHKLQTLILTKNNLSGKKWHFLEDSFKSLSLKNISLGSCSLSHDVKDIGEIFRFNPTLKYIDLSHNQINDAGFESFEKYPKVNVILEEIDVSSNYISDKSASGFFKNLEENTTMLKLNFFDNHLGNESAKSIIEILKTNRNIVNINVTCNNIGLRVLDEIKNKIKNNRNIEQVKYIPKLKNELKDLEFDPNEIKYLKNKINYSCLERKYNEKKFMKEVKDLESRKKENLKNTKDVTYSAKKIEKQINNLQKNFINIKDEEINEIDTFNNNINIMKEKISLIETELKDVNFITYNLKHNYNEEVQLYKHTYDQTKQKENALQMDIISLNHGLKSLENKYKQKLDYLERLQSTVLKKKTSGILKFKSDNIRYSNKIQH